jgi:exodeoxyribonuclease VII large subunit
MEEKMTLTELQQVIRDSLYISLPDFYWVTAEISEMKENSAGHCYLELIEKHPDDKNVRARVRAVIWSSKYRFLGALFRNATGETLSEGMKVLVRIKIEYHELYGLSLVISDIDPSYTMGEMALRRQAIIRRLEEEGVFRMNKDLDFPILPQRIAVISSENAAGYRDFINHLRGNSFNYVFYTALFEAVMQGVETEKSVISALDRIADHPGIFDVVAIIRGGGSQSDLSWFDNYNIAYHVTQFPIPVITGIGHDKDMSVTDMVASTALKTPTAVAGLLIDKIAETESGLNELISGINEIVRSAIDLKRNQLEVMRIKMIAAADSMTTGKKHSLDNYRTGILKGTFYLLDKIRTGLGMHENSLKILDPVNVLKRGYSITKINNRILKDPLEASIGDQLSTVLYKGEIDSTVTRILNPSENETKNQE